MVSRAKHRTAARRRRSLLGAARTHARPRPVERRHETGIAWVAEKLGATAIAAAGATLDIAFRTFDAPDVSSSRARDGAGDAGPDDAMASGTSIRSWLIERVNVAGVGALPLVCVIAAGTGAAIVMQGTMAPQPPSPELGRLLVVVVLREIAPLFTALLVAGHAGPIVDPRLASAPGVERDCARTCHIVGSAIAVTALTIHFAAVAMASAFITSCAVTLRTYGAVRDGLLHELALFDAPIVIGKALVLGMMVGWLGLRADDERARGDSGGHSASRLFVRSLLSASVLSVGVTLCLYAIIGKPPPP